MKRTGNQAIRLIVLLGNPGKQYAQTRHNVGWMVAPYLSSSSSWKEKFHGRFVKDGEQVILMPDTFMNHSGRSVQAASAFFNVSPEETLIVHDDMETSFGSICLTFGGGHRGNNGVRSVATTLSSNDFWRLRIGVGRPPANRRPGDWILERFTSDEETSLSTILQESARIIRDNIAVPEDVTLSLRL